MFKLKYVTKQKVQYDNEQKLMLVFMRLRSKRFGIRQNIADKPFGSVPIRSDAKFPIRSDSVCGISFKIMLINIFRFGLVCGNFKGVLCARTKGDMFCLILNSTNYDARNKSKGIY